MSENLLLIAKGPVVEAKGLVFVGVIIAMLLSVSSAGCCKCSTRIIDCRHCYCHCHISPSMSFPFFDTVCMIATTL